MKSGKPGSSATPAVIRPASLSDWPPALRGGFVETAGIVIDSKSGTTGAGRGLSQTTHFPDCNEAFSAYKVASHRHTPRNRTDPLQNRRTAGERDLRPASPAG